MRPLFVVSKEAAEKSTEVTATRFHGEAPPLSSGGHGQSAPIASASSERIATDAAPTEATVTLLDGTAPRVSCGDNGQSAPTVLVPGENPAMKAASQEQESTESDAITGGLLDKTIVVAPAPEESIPRGLPTPDLLAHVFVGKYADKLPFNRQEGISAREGVPITRGTMCG